MPVISALPLEFLVFSAAAGHVLTRHSGSLLMYSWMKLPTSATSP